MQDAGARSRPSRSEGVTRLEFVRDPLWNNIRLEPDALELLDTPAVQRLRYVRQLGHAFLVYPGATHTRFEHALGAYHLARRALTPARGERSTGSMPRTRTRLRSAALLHDIGHYPFSHALEEAGLPAPRERSRSDTSRVTDLADGPRAARRPARHQAPGLDSRADAASPLGGLVSGSLDVDKLDYLSRDALDVRRALRGDRRGAVARPR